MSPILTESDQNALLDQPKIRYTVELRNLFILHLGLKHGVRLTEQIFLKWKHTDPSTGQLLIQGGHGINDRCLFAAEGTLELLKEWKEQQIYEWEKRNTGYSRKPKFVLTTLRGMKLSKRYIRNTVNRYANDAGIDKDVTPNSLRKTFAENLYEKSGNLRLVQKALGHRNLTTTMMYINTVPEELSLGQSPQKFIEKRE